MASVVIIFVLAAALALVKSVQIVPPHERWTVERMGKASHTLTPGFHLLIPGIDCVTRKDSNASASSVRPPPKSEKQTEEL